MLTCIFKFSNLFDIFINCSKQNINLYIGDIMTSTNYNTNY